MAAVALPALAERAQVEAAQIAFLALLPPLAAGVVAPVKKERDLVLTVARVVEAVRRDQVRRAQAAQELQVKVTMAGRAVRIILAFAQAVAAVVRRRQVQIIRQALRVRVVMVLPLLSAAHL